MKTCTNAVGEAICDHELCLPHAGPTRTSMAGSPESSCSLFDVSYQSKETRTMIDIVTQKRLICSKSYRWYGVGVGRGMPAQGQNTGFPASHKTSYQCPAVLLPPSPPPSQGERISEKCG
ncbi:hypothetical protein TNCV_2816411 [Trichonephila clavipes]|nr:hypothetical protein TNCV_2816411 [Trichonephila clavipes]